MKKKNSTAQLKKANLYNKYLQDPKIRKIYLSFKKKLFEKINNKPFCIGVSGGPDSLALAFLCKVFAREHNSNFTALIVDHKLRKESGIEAKKVKKILTKNKIKNRVLTWNGEIPNTNIQFNARKIRYSLFTKMCKKLNVENLVLAHQEGDLIENFFIRLFRGSGLKGLSSLSEKRKNTNNGFNLIRPLINVSKNELIYISRKVFQFYLVDPSNFKKNFLRTRIRNYLDKFKSEGFDVNKVKLTLNNLQIANEAIDFYKEKSMKKYTRHMSNDSHIVRCSIFNFESEEVIFRTIGDVITKVSNNYYPPRGKNLQSLIAKMQLKNFKKTTLGGCIIEKSNNILILKKEFDE